MVLCNHLKGYCVNEICFSDCCYLLKREYYKKNEYNYKCPDCNGEFTFPSIQSTSTISYKCPFCGRIMIGVVIKEK